MARIVLGVALVGLIGCNRPLSGDDAFDLRTERSRMNARMLALSSHLGEQEKAEATHPERIAPPKMHPPTAAELKANQASQPEGIAAYRAHIALLGEKQLLTDMQVSLAAIDASGTRTSARARLAELDAKLGAIEGAQRERDHALGIPRPEQP